MAFGPDISTVTSLVVKKIKIYIFFIIIEPNFFGIYYYYYYRCWYYLLLLTIPEIVHDLGYMVFIVR